MDKDTLEFIALGLFALISISVAVYRISQLNDPNDHTVIYTSQLPEVLRLRDGSYALHQTRQSGNEYKPSYEIEGLDMVNKELMKILKRNHIEEIIIDQNTPSSLSVKRMLKNQGGKNEGKKLGSVKAVLIKDATYLPDQVLDEANGLVKELDHLKILIPEVITTKEELKNAETMAELTKQAISLKGKYPLLSISNIDLLDKALQERIQNKKIE